MTPRLNAFAAAPAPMKSWLDFSQGLKQLGLEASLMDLVVTRASQINGCAFCLDMHTSDARKRGETEQRLYLLDAWRDSPLYSERERAALAWTDQFQVPAVGRLCDRSQSRGLIRDPPEALLAAEHREHVEIPGEVERPVRAARNGWATIPSFAPCSSE